MVEEDEYPERTIGSIKNVAIVKQNKFLNQSIAGV
jgi:hypothetical protein